MNLVDYLAQVSAILGGTMVIAHAYLSGFKSRGFPGTPWVERGGMLFVGLALWLRAGMIYPAAMVVNERYPNGHHVTVAESFVYGTLCVWMAFRFINYFITAHRWYTEGQNLGVAGSDRPTIRNVPEQIREGLKEELPKAMDEANQKLFSQISGPVKHYGGRS